MGAEYDASGTVQAGGAGGNEIVYELPRCPIQPRDATVAPIGHIQIAVRSKDQPRAYVRQPGREDCSCLARGGHGIARDPVVAHHATVLRTVNVELAVSAKHQTSWTPPPAP